MENNPGNLTIGAFAKAAGVNVDTIRFYQREGLLLEPEKPHGVINPCRPSNAPPLATLDSVLEYGSKVIPE